MASSSKKTTKNVKSSSSSKTTKNVKSSTKTAKNVKSSTKTAKNVKSSSSQNKRTNSQKSNSPQKQTKATQKVNKKVTAQKKNTASNRNVQKRKDEKRKLNNIEVRNKPVAARKKNRNLKIAMPKLKDNSPLIYDEEKYLRKLKKSGRKNLFYITVFFSLALVVSLAFILKLQISHTKHGNDLEAYAQNTYTETKNIKSNRGTIYDTNGEALAINLEVYTLRAVTDEDYECNIDSEFVNCSIEDSSEAAAAIGEALSLSGSEQAYIEERLNYGIDEGKYEVTFGTIGKNITLSEKQALEQLNYSWLQFDPQELRFYPYGDFASYIVGYTAKDDETGEITGALGVEKALDGHLKGQDGIETSLFDNYGIELTEAQQSAIPKVDGTDVYLTLDSVVQTYLESSMEKSLEQDELNGLEYDGLFTIIMDAKTGDILAAQSYPTYDPNVREIENYTNYFTDYCFEPGSTLKTATIAAADEAGVWSDTASNPTGSRSASTWGGLTIKDWNNGIGWGTINWSQGYYFSSNTILTYIMDKISHDFWTDFATNKLMLGQSVQTQFIETPNCVFDPKYDVDFATTSFGQGMTVNVLQILRMYSALVGDGEMVTPHIVEKITDSETGEVIYTDEDLEVITDVVSSDTSAHIRELLRGVVTYDDGVNTGTGRRYNGSTYDIGMKTGTAQMAGPNGKYIDNQYLYSAVAVAPIDDPQIIIYTAAIAPNNPAISSVGFSQYVKEVSDNTISYLNSENREVNLEDSQNIKNTKNYVGKELDEVDDKGIIKIGTGEVASQYPKAGQQISTSQNIILFGTDNLEFPNVKGFTYNETVAICNQLNTTCEFTNTGTKVKSVTNESENKYKIKME